MAKHSDHALVVGDLNVGHTELDIRNWKGNVKRAGFLPEERAYFDRFFGEDIGWMDVHRGLAGNVDGPYTWWSQRGEPSTTTPAGALITTWPRPRSLLPQYQPLLTGHRPGTPASPTTPRW